MAAASNLCTDTDIVTLRARRVGSGGAPVPPPTESLRGSRCAKHGPTQALPRADHRTCGLAGKAMIAKPTGWVAESLDGVTRSLSVVSKRVGMHAVRRSQLGRHDGDPALGARVDGVMTVGRAEAALPGLSSIRPIRPSESQAGASVRVARTSEGSPSSGARPVRSLGGPVDELCSSPDRRETPLQAVLARPRLVRRAGAAGCRIERPAPTETESGRNRHSGTPTGFTQADLQASAAITGRMRGAAFRRSRKLLVKLLGAVNVISECCPPYRHA